MPGFKLPDLIKVPLFSIASDFYTVACMAERPAVDTSVASIKTWLEENEHYVYRVVERAVTSWAITGRAVLVANEDGRLAEVYSSSYFRVGPDYDQDELVGHILAYPYREFTELELRNPNIAQRIPNRLRVVRYQKDKDINTVQTFAMDGYVVGEPSHPRSLRASRPCAS